MISLEASRKCNNQGQYFVRSAKLTINKEDFLDQGSDCTKMCSLFLINTGCKTSLLVV